MIANIISVLIGATAMSYTLLAFIYEKYRRKRERCSHLRRLMEAKMQDDYEAMEAYKALIRKACMENAQENFHKKG